MALIQMRTSFHKTTSNGEKQEKKAFSLGAVNNWIKHNNRVYEHTENLSKYCKSHIDFNDTFLNEYYYYDNTPKSEKMNYENWFNNQFKTEIINEYNQGKKPSRQIKNNNVFKFYTDKEHNKQAIAEQLIFQIGDETTAGKLKATFKNEQWYKNWYSQYHKRTINFVKKYIPEFKIYNSALHMDETTPHIHIIGIGIQETPTAKQGLKQRVVSTNLFTKTRLKKIHEETRAFNQGAVQELEQVLKENNIYVNEKTGEFKQIEKQSIFNRRWKHIKLEAIQENAPQPLKVKDKETANLIQRIQNRELKQSDALVLTLEINEAYKFKETAPSREVIENLINARTEEYKEQNKITSNEIENRAKLQAEFYKQELEMEYLIKTENMDEEIWKAGKQAVANYDDMEKQVEKLKGDLQIQEEIALDFIGKTQELKKENKILKYENKQLRQENSQLEAQIDNLTPSRSYGYGM